MDIQRLVMFEVSEEEQSKAEQVLQHVSRIAELDLRKVSPTVTPGEQVTVLRNDVVDEGGCTPLGKSIRVPKYGGR